MKYLILIAFLMFPMFSIGQIDTAQVYKTLFEDDENLEEEEEEKEGIPIFISLQPALYIPYNGIANYYNGSVKEINIEDRYVIQSIWDNPNNKRLIKDDLGLNDAQYNSVEFDESNFNYIMQYNLGYMIGFQAFMAFKPRFMVYLGFNFVSMNTASYITISVPDYESPNPDINSTVIKMEVFGKEQRIITDLGMHWILGKKDLKYYVEGGANFLMAKANENYFKTGEHQWNLMRNVNNNTAANTITSFTFGGFAGAGLFFKANEDFAFELGGQVAINSVEFPGRTGYFPNYIVSLRIIYLSKNSKL